jgi:hypothetical protein
VIEMGADPLEVSNYVIVKDGCPIRFEVMGSGQVEVTFGAPRNGCQVMFAAEALRAMLDAAALALREMDDRFEREHVW